MMSFYQKEYGVRFSQGYGMTETSPLVSLGSLAARYADAQLDEAGQFANVTVAGSITPCVEMRLVDPEDFSKEVPQDGESTGELLMRGPWVTDRYYLEDFPDRFSDGWLASGDIAAIKDGVLMIRDRSKDLIKSGGEWISSKDVEMSLAEVPWLEQCALIGVAHPKWDERPIVVASTKGTPPATAEQRLAEVRAPLSHFPKYALPDDVVVWDALPMTGTGKISKKDIRVRLKEEGYVLPDLRKGTSKL
eukprot:NODE_1408_length_1149_cov_177.451554.p1 GENE.NODE_1408_length_1149_cov_177.451554~~NODE_1408_length_1149_cov_177.451554.p1  ORF type:complete len:266 (-),score=90.28 NODE_1408_length_1149_cov_177.451554:350-1093(-)